MVSIIWISTSRTWVFFDQRVRSVVVDHGWPGGHMGRFFGCSKTLIDKEYYAKKRYWLSLITFEILARQNLYQERRKTAIWPLRDVHGRPNLDSSKELVELYKIPLKTRKIGISLHKSLKPHNLFYIWNPFAYKNDMSSYDKLQVTSGALFRLIRLIRLSWS